MKTLTAAATLLAGLVAFTNAAYAINLNNVQNNKVHYDTYNCADEMGFMRRVSQDDILTIDGQDVRLIAVCDDGTYASRTSYGPLFVEGNAETLRRPIARNDTLMSALRQQDYDQFDVVSLRFGANDSIILYVHQRDMR